MGKKERRKRKKKREEGKKEGMKKKKASQAEHSILFDHTDHVFPDSIKRYLLYIFGHLSALCWDSLGDKQAVPSKI